MHPTPTTPTTPAPLPAITPRQRWLLASLILIIATLGLASIGSTEPLWISAGAVLERALLGGIPALAYLAAAAGLGRLIPGLSQAREKLPLQVCAGLAIMLWCSHAFGSLGFFSGAAGRLVALSPFIVGLSLLSQQLIAARRAGTLRIELPPFIFASAVGVALLMVASSNPPGWLWDSEFGGYDALSYHLQLPQEWLVRGRIESLTHNVYSFLPSSIESAFYHLAAVTGAPASPPSTPAEAGAPWGLVADGARLAHSAQFLHAGCTLIAAWVIGRLAFVTTGRAGLDIAAQRIASGFASTITLITPWSIVCGSLAYNELAMVALGAAAALAALEDNFTPLRRGVLAGLLVGAACACKPTAIMLIGAPIGILLLAAAPRNAWGAIILGACIGGLAMIAAWLIRNAVACGNPVFPFAASIFPSTSGGTGHWTAEQVTRFKLGHTFSGSFLERIRLILLPDHSDPAGSRHRGMLHPQWGILFPVTLAAAIGLTCRRGTQSTPIGRIAMLLWVLLLASTIIWLFTTHVQSRFLLPLIATAAVLAALAIASLHAPRRAAVAWIVIIAQLTYSVVIFQSQRSGEPNAALVQGAALLSGEMIREPLKSAPPQDIDSWVRTASPEQLANTLLPPGDMVLVGAATPFYYSRDVRYATTWDTPAWVPPPAEPGTPADVRNEAWIASLRAQNIHYLLISFGELGRLERSRSLDPSLHTQDFAQFALNSLRPVMVWDQSQTGIFEVPPRSPPKGQPTGQPNGQPAAPAPAESSGARGPN